MASARAESAALAAARTTTPAKAPTSLRPREGGRRGDGRHSAAWATLTTSAIRSLVDALRAIPASIRFHALTNAGAL